VEEPEVKQRTGYSALAGQHQLPARASCLITICLCARIAYGATPQVGSDVDPTKKEVVDLSNQIEHLKADRQFSRAATLIKHWLDSHQSELTTGDQVHLERQLSDLQINADQLDEALATIERTSRLMKRAAQKFRGWEFSTVSAECEEISRWKNVTSDQRRRLLQAREHVTRIQGGQGPREVDKSQRAQLEEDLRAVVTILSSDRPSILIASIRENLALTLNRLQEWQLSETEIQTALRERIALYGQMHPQTAMTRGMMALILSNPKRSDPRMYEAISLFGDAATILERTLGPADENTLFHFETAAIRCSAAHRPDLELQYADRLFNGLRLAHPKDNRRLARAIELIAESARDVGNFPVALENYDRLLVVCQGSRDKKGEASSLLGRGQTHLAAGEFQLAIVDLNRAADMLATFADQESIARRSSCLVALAHVLLDSGKRNEAKAYLDKAKHILAAGQRESILVHRVWFESGRVYRSLKEWKSACTAFQEALKAAPTTTVTTVAPQVAETRRLLADSELQLGNVEGALKQLAAARDMSIDRLGRWHATTATIQLELGLLKLLKQTPKSARESLAEAVLGLTASANSLGLVAESEGIRRLARINYARDALLSCLRSGEATPAEFYSYVSRTRGIWTRHSMGRFASAADDPTVAEDLNNLRDVKVQISNLLWNAPLPKAETIQELRAATEKKRWLESRLSFRQSVPTEDSAVLLDKLPKLLPSNVAIIDFVSTSQLEPNHDRTKLERQVLFYECYVLRSTDGGRRMDIKRVELGTQRALGATMLRWREATSRERIYTKPVTRAEKLPAEPDAVERLAAMSDDRAYRECGQDLRKYVWDRIEPLLRGIDTIVILPDVDFDRMPWYALPGRKAGTNLIDDYAICTALNCQHVIALLREMANPARVARPSHAGSLFVDDVKYGEGRWPSLKASAKDLTEIMGLKAVPSPKIWLHDKKARPFEVAQEMMQRQFAYLSTHGEFSTRQVSTTFDAHFMSDRDYDPPFDPDALFQHKLKLLAARRAGTKLAQPAGDVVAGQILEESPLSCAALALSEAGTGAAPWKSADILSGEVIASLDLRGVDVVVLSACETTRGPSLIGEGTLSLQRACLLAGARTVIGSLWEVDEAATDELTKQFCINLFDRGLTKIEALRDAQRKMRDGYNNQTQQSPHDLAPGLRTPPRLWAQFMLTGDWGNRL
jgi:CHAT domain-containing protein/tetratricopeptide (TPR) repeat protein